MDILAARKKAAEKERTRKKQEMEPPADFTATHDEKSPHPSELVSPPPLKAAVVPAPVASAAGEPETKAAVSQIDETGAMQSSEIELLSFRMGGEEYAVMVADVREVQKTHSLTSVPNVPDYVLGIMSLRGTMLPVIDLCKRLGLAPDVRDEKSRIIVVSSGDEEVGLMVDRVTGVFRIPAEEIKPTPENIEKGAEFLRGIARKDDRLFILLDLEKAVGF